MEMITSKEAQSLVLTPTSEDGQVAESILNAINNSIIDNIKNNKFDKNSIKRRFFFDMDNRYSWQYNGWLDGLNKANIRKLVFSKLKEAGWDARLSYEYKYIQDRRILEIRAKSWWPFW